MENHALVFKTSCPPPSGAFHLAEGAGVKPARLIARLCSREVPSSIGLPFQEVAHGICTRLTTFCRRVPRCSACATQNVLRFELPKPNSALKTQPSKRKRGDVPVLPRRRRVHSAVSCCWTNTPTLAAEEGVKPSHSGFRDRRLYRHKLLRIKGAAERTQTPTSAFRRRLRYSVTLQQRGGRYGRTRTCTCAGSKPVTSANWATYLLEPARGVEPRFCGSKPRGLPLADAGVLPMPR